MDRQLLPDTILEISWKAIQHNIAYFRSRIKASTKIMFMVKASAYGNSASQITRKIQEEKLADYFGVATIREGVELRENGIRLPILIQNPHFDDWDILVKHYLEPVIQNTDGLHSIQRFLDSSNEAPTQYPIHIELNTGMNRFGFDQQDLKQLMQFIKEATNCRLASVMTHLSSSGNKLAEEFTMQQLELFHSMVQELKPQLNEHTFFHALNTDGMHNFTEYQFDMIRIGIGLYGASEAEQLKNSLIPIATFKTRVSAIRRVDKAEGISYNRSGKLKEDSNIAVLSLGYADGFPRLLGNGKWEVEINGKLYPTIGAICMDLCMVNLGNDLVKVGDEAIIFGRKKSIFDYAEALHTITYEAMTIIGKRVQRIIR